MKKERDRKRLINDKERERGRKIEQERTGHQFRSPELVPVLIH